MIDEELDDIIQGTTSRLKALNKSIYETIINYFVDNFSIGDDTIKYTQSNIGVVEKLSIEIKKLETPLSNLGKYILRGINRMIGVTTTQMSKGNPGANAAGKSAVEILMDHAKKNIGSNLKVDPMFNEIKERSLRLLSRPEGIGLKDLRRSLEDAIINKGVSEKYFARWTGDIYSQYQRASANIIRKELGLKHARYAGGLIETSRPFCEERNGNVYDEEEIESWADEDFAGKSDPYDPIIDCGGYNCRHRLDWISEELFDELKSEEDVNGSAGD